MKPVTLGQLIKRLQDWPPSLAVVLTDKDPEAYAGAPGSTFSFIALENVMKELGE